MQYHILHGFTECDIDRALAELEQLPLCRYDNPFEQKDFLENKTDILDKAALSYCIQELLLTSKIASQLLNLPIAHVDWRHYGGLFRYNPGDYLEPHVDAGIHPKTGQRKIGTILLYLTDAVLSFWQGDNCTTPSDKDLEVWLEQTVVLRAGEAILFPNHDTAWHSVPQVQQTRVCLTVSYMAYENFTHSRYQNPRTRAYFARRHGVPESPELSQLRLKRASEEGHADVYRI